MIDDLMPLPATHPPTALAIAARYSLETYRAGLAAHTRRRQDADLALFARYLSVVGLQAGDLATEPPAWAGITWGLVEGFGQWCLKQGYAVGSVNVRLSTVKVSAREATRAGVISPEAFALIETVKTVRHARGRHIDEQRPVTRVGDKKAAPVSITAEQARALKAQPLDTPQGRRDALLMCLLLDHGLRVGEIAGLPASAIDLKRKTLTFFRSKVDKVQTHNLTIDTLVAASAYLATDAPAAGPLLRGSRKNGQLVGAVGTRSMSDRVRVLGEAVGIKGLSPHDCRHYWATAAVRGGTDIKALQDAGGWSSPAMPLRYAEAGAIANAGVKLGE